MPDETARKAALHLLPAVVGCVLLVAGCALPLATSRPAPAPRTHAAAPTTTPGTTPVAPFAAVVAVVQNCAAGAGFPGQSRRTRIQDFGTCLGIQDVPAAVVPCAERQFRLHGTQGAEAVALGVKAECGKPSPTGESTR